MKQKLVRLYDYQFSGNGYKIRLALAQLNIEVVVTFLDLLKGETWTPGFYEKNPMGQIPVLELDDGTFLRESNAILYWLTNDTVLMPDDLMGKTSVLQWMFFEQSNIDKVLGRTRFLKAFPDFMETTEKDWTDWYSIGNRALQVLDNHLENTDFLVNNTYSAADISLYSYVHTAEEGGFKLAQYLAVQRWLDNVRSMPRHIMQYD